MIATINDRFSPSNSNDDQLSGELPTSNPMSSIQLTRGIDLWGLSPDPMNIC